MDIVYQDRDVILCVKQPGQSSELSGEESAPVLLREQLGGSVLPVHRLDLNVGGLLLCARSREAAAALSRAVAGGAVVKEYQALIHGCPTPPEGELQDLLWKDARRNKVYVVNRMRRGVREARLWYQVLEPGEQSRLLVRLITGRSHQIRVQFASRGWPLVGDHKYGSRDTVQQPALWSWRLTFPHPRTGERMSFTQTPPF